MFALYEIKQTFNNFAVANVALCVFDAGFKASGGCELQFAFLQCSFFGKRAQHFDNLICVFAMDGSDSGVKFNFQRSAERAPPARGPQNV